MMSAWDVVRTEFESPHVQAFMLWQAFQTLVPVDATAPARSPTRSSSAPAPRLDPARGGSGQLTDALVRSIVDDGGACSAIERCRGCCSRAGAASGWRPRTVSASAPEGVVSTIHVKHLVEMAPAEAWGEDFLYGVRTYDLGLSGFAVYLATTSPPSFRTPTGPAARSRPASPAGPSRCSITGAGSRRRL